VSGGTSFFLQKELADLLQELGFDVLAFVRRWTRTYGDEVTAAAETATATAGKCDAAATTTATTTARKVTGRSVVVVATWGFGGGGPDQSYRQALQRNRHYLQTA
jgi:hypothetical protein